MRHLRWPLSVLLICLALLYLTPPSTAQMAFFCNEDFKQFLSKPQKTFFIYLQGNQSVTTGAGAFVVNNWTHVTEQVIHQGNLRTIIKFTGDPVAQGTAIHVGFGVNGGSTSHGKVFENPHTFFKAWGGQHVVPCIDAHAGAKAKTGPTKYVLFFAQAQFSGGSAGQPYTGVVGDWNEFCLPKNGLPKTGKPQVLVSNLSSNTMTLSNAGYFLSDTQIPLDQLNRMDEPPPGSPNSPFIPLPNLDGTTIKPFQQTNLNGQVSSVPELSSVYLLLCCGGVGAGATYLRRHRR